MGSVAYFDKHSVRIKVCKIAYKVKTVGIIQTDFEFQGDKFWRLLASAVKVMGSVAYFDKHSV